MDCRCETIEAHHRHKVDVPSDTALHMEIAHKASPHDFCGWRHACCLADRNQGLYDM